MTDETPKDRWNELVPDAFANDDDPHLAEIIDCVILVRLNWLDGEETHVGTEITAGRVLRANRQEGFVLGALGAVAGEEFCLPLVPEALSQLEPGNYALSDNTVIRNPDYLIAFDVYRPAH